MVPVPSGLRRIQSQPSATGARRQQARDCDNGQEHLPHPDGVPRALIKYATACAACDASPNDDVRIDKTRSGPAFCKRMWAASYTR